MTPEESAAWSRMHVAGLEKKVAGLTGELRAAWERELEIARKNAREWGAWA